MQPAKKPKRVKPTNAAKQATHSAQAEDYRKLGEAVVRAIILKQRDVVFRTPYFVRFSEDFPKGVLEHKTAEHNYYRAKAFRLADWLYRHNYLPADAKGIVLSTRDLVFREAKLNKLLVDAEQSQAYNNCSELEGDNNGSED